MTTPSGPTAGARRRRYALQTTVLLLAVTFACIFAGVIASGRRVRAQMDLTGTRAHRLSERATGIVRSLDATYDIVIAADLRTVEPITKARTLDVLDAFARASDHIHVRIIDTATSRGMGEFDALLTDLAARYKPEIDAQLETVRAALEASQKLTETLGKLSAELLAARELVKESDTNGKLLRDTFESDAARFRVAAQKLRDAGAAAQGALTQRIGPTSVPALDVAARDLGAALSVASSELAAVGTRVAAIAGSGDVPQPVRDRAVPAATTIKANREGIDVYVERLTRMPVIPLIAVARTLEKTSAALVIGPPKKGAGAAVTLRAIEFDELFPPRQPQQTGSGVLDLRSRAEELVTTALASLGSAKAPIVVLVHNALSRDGQGRAQPVRLSPVWQGFTGLVERLRLRGMDIVEWQVGLDAEQPPLTRLNPDGSRPVVYATLGSAATDADGAMAMKRLTDTQNKLVTDGKALLINVNVSTRPTIGDTDPLTECLGLLGVAVDSGRPLLRQFQGPKGRLVLWEQLTTEAVGGTSEDTQPIARAVHGLRCRFPWAVPLRAATPRDGKAPISRITPLIDVRDTRDVWAEAEWLSFAQTNAADRAYLTNLPAPDAARDDTTGAWTIAAAVESTRPGQPKPQRAVVVGCAAWFFDEITQATLGVVDGRPVYQAPGNLELFEASVYWLAGQDEMIARSASAEAVPLIPALNSGQLGLIRWMLIAGLPVVVLLIGAGWRLMRG